MAEVKNHNGRPAIFIDGKPYAPMMATLRTNNRENLVLDEEYMKRLGESGIKIFYLICDTLWLKPNAVDLFKEEAEALLKAVPDAYIVPRIGMHPTNEWMEENPEECVTYSDGSRPSVHLFSESYETDIPMHYSLCSTKWQKRAGEALEETWKILMSLPYADRIIGCFLCAGGTSEWYYMLPVERGGAVADHSEAFKRHFTKYLTKKYGTDEALQKAWKDGVSTLKNPKIPEPDQHYFAFQCDKDCAVPKCSMYSNSDVPPPYGNGTNIGAFVDVDENRATWDFYTAWDDGTADSVLYFAQIIKRLTPDKLVGAFYGYNGCTSFLGMGNAGGVVKILDSGLVEFLSCPDVYENRHIGLCEGGREYHDSFAIRNRIFIVEQDTRTYHENRYYADKYGVYDLEDSINIMKRDFGRILCEDIQGWWFDQILGGRRYKDEALYSLIAKQQQIAKESFERSRAKGNEIACIYDEESLFMISSQSSRELVELTRNYELPRVGAPVDYYYHDDFALENMPKYKMYIFFNTLSLSDKDRKAILNKLNREKAVAVWMYAPGVVNPDKTPSFSTEYMKELTGFSMEMLNERFDAKFRATDRNHPITRELDARKIYGAFDRKRIMAFGDNDRARWDSYLYPLFYASDENAENIATFVLNGKPAISVGKNGDFTSVYYGSKNIDCNTIRSLAKFAGCHIYSDSNDVVYANDNYVTIHASESGAKTIRFKQKSNIYEVYENKCYGKNVDEITFDMVFGQTKTFRIDK